jgi:hypothetical protein
MQIKHEDRLLFLKEFTKELIINSKLPEEPKTEAVEKEQYEIALPFELTVEKEMKEKPTPKLPLSARLKIKPSLMPFPKPKYKLKPILPHGFVPSIKPIRPFPKPKPQPLPQTAKALNLGKLNFLISDPRVTVIECLGPGKFVLAKTSGQVKMTKVSLSQKEIQETIEKFSISAKIPIISGLFKAAVGNLVITAVISGLVGSRFIITKITPRYILEQQTQTQQRQTNQIKTA